MTAHIQRYLLLAATFLLLTLASGSALGDARSVHADGEDEQPGESTPGPRMFWHRLLLTRRLPHYTSF